MIIEGSLLLGGLGSRLGDLLFGGKKSVAATNEGMNGGRGHLEHTLAEPPADLSTDLMTPTATV